MIHANRLPAAPRVHAIILTQDRTEELKRCVETALTGLGRCDVVTVLDDSHPERAAVNRAMLAPRAKRCDVSVSHLLATRLHDALAHPGEGSRNVWQCRTAARDIAPLRNLSLLLSVAVGADATVLIDDDVCGFDLAATHRFVVRQQPNSNGVVAGAKIDGLTEMDTISRLEQAMALLKEEPRKVRASTSELFRAASRDGERQAQECLWVSAGYLAFSIPPASLRAFPPGYNEDWLWCLLQHAEQSTRILRMEQAVRHEPTSLRRPTCDDVRFELLGDLILEALVECKAAEWRNESLMSRLRAHRPDCSTLPASRVAETMVRAAEIERLGRMHPDLQEYGLHTLTECVRTGRVEVDGCLALAAWCRDAEEKQNAFAPTPGNKAVLATLRMQLAEGQV